MSTKRPRVAEPTVILGDLENSVSVAESKTNTVIRDDWENAFTTLQDFLEYGEPSESQIGQLRSLINRTEDSIALKKQSRFIIGQYVTFATSRGYVHSGLVSGFEKDTVLIAVLVHGVTRTWKISPGRIRIEKL